jgi:hypothetical protein
VQKLSVRHVSNPLRSPREMIADQPGAMKGGIKETL